MARHALGRGAWVRIVFGAGLYLLAGNTWIAAAAEKEIREFTIKIDDKPAGLANMIISSPDERTFNVEIHADISVSYVLGLFKVYKYTYQGTEVWINGRLMHLESKTNDNGKPLQVLVKPDRDILRVKGNGMEHTARPDVLTTSYWRLPSPPFRNQEVFLLDCDTGKNLRGMMQYIGTQQLTVASQTQNCLHYRLTGDVRVDAWYDAQLRLVRQVTIEDSHSILLELARIGR
jgi:Domain of unknown function (DUF6134)